MAKLPLSHINVLDLTAHRAGPTAVRQLADWGAHVIKIEPPSDGKLDAMGGARHGFDFQNLHRNKQAITLNLKSKEGHKIFMKLARKADVIVENYRSDVKYRLKVDYKSVKKVNPKIIYGSIAGFGQDGPDAARPGVDQIAQGMGGLMSITGLPGQGPVRVGIPIADLTAGLVLVTGPTGSGKSTTLAAMIDHMNRHRRGHILTIEDPVEFVHQPRQCLITHKEVGVDVPSFLEAIRSAGRENADVILVGEIRDPDTARIAVQSALTGHFVLSSLHGTDASAALHRLLDMGIEEGLRGAMSQMDALLAA